MLATATSTLYTKFHYHHFKIVKEFFNKLNPCPRALTADYKLSSKNKSGISTHNNNGAFQVSMEPCGSSLLPQLCHRQSNQQILTTVG